MTPIEKFFRRYEEGANTFEPAIVISAYPDAFMAADPNGAACIQNDAAFRKAIPGREALFRKIGFKSAEVLKVTETPMDERYTTALVQWRMVFEKEQGKPLEFVFFITYILLAGKDGLKIVFYLSHDDEQKLMRDAGLI
jgi:hypothetical protein